MNEDFIEEVSHQEKTFSLSDEELFTFAKPTITQNSFGIISYSRLTSFLELKSLRKDSSQRIQYEEDDNILVFLSDFG